MKKILLILLSLFSTNLSSAQFKPRASIDYFLEGYNMKVYENIQIPGIGVFENSVISRYGRFRVRIGGEYRIKRLGLYFDQNVYMIKANSIFYRPLQAEWYTGAKFYITNDISIKAEHLCMHPIMSDVLSKNNSRVYGGYNMISISYGY